MKKQFSDRLREGRIAAGLTQEQLGFALDLTKSAISAWENGRDKPSFELLPKLRETLGCSLDQLICGTDFQYGGVKEKAADRSNDLVARDQLEAKLLLMLRAMPLKKRKALLEVIQ